MLGLELVVVLGAVILVCTLLVSRLHVALPVLLLVFGLLLGFVPTLRAVHLPPEAVLLIFLPALLFWESLTTSLREIRQNLRAIVLASTALVVATAAAVAAAGHAMGLPWGPAWVLGSALAPTDATAVGVLTRALPRRNVTVLRAESLVNDGTALVLYGLAVGVTAGEEDLGAWHVTGLVALSYFGGAAAGAVVALAASVLYRRLRDAQAENVATLLAPFAAFLLAEAIGASGVLAVVVCGLAISQIGPRTGLAATREQVAAFLSLATYLLNGALFVLIGLQAQAAIHTLSGRGLVRGLVLVLVISGVVIGGRLAWMFTSPYIVRAIDRRPQQRARRAPARSRVLVSFVGFRGAVSLAAALGVPGTVRSGAPFPDRNLIVFVTAGVIVVSLVQALFLPALVRFARLPPDLGLAQESELAERTATEEALAALPEIADELDVTPAVVDRLSKDFEKRLRVLQAGHDGDDGDGVVQWTHDYGRLHLAAIARKRATVVRLRDEQRIDDTVLRDLMVKLDREELRLSDTGSTD